MDEFDTDDEEGPMEDLDIRPMIEEIMTAYYPELISVYFPEISEARNVETMSQEEPEITGATSQEEFEITAARFLDVLSQDEGNYDEGYYEEGNYDEGNYDIGPMVNANAITSEHCSRTPEEIRSRIVETMDEFDTVDEIGPMDDLYVRPIVEDSRTPEEMKAHADRVKANSNRIMKEFEAKRQAELHENQANHQADPPQNEANRQANVRENQSETPPEPTETTKTA